MQDHKQRFLFPDSDIRGELVQVESSVTRIIEGHNYPLAVQGLIGEAVAAVVAELITTAPAVLLDEPTEHLDSSDAEQILVDLLTPGALFGPDRTVVVATHHLGKDVDCRTVDLAPER